MKFKCSYDLCESLPSLFCSCSSQAIFLCQNHFAFPSRKNSNANLEIKLLFKNISEDCKEEFIRSFTDILN